jgi:hypothetical protein
MGRRCVPILLLLVACGGTSQPSVAPEPAAEPAKSYVPVAAVKPPPTEEAILPATDYLNDDFATTFERRARVATWGPVRLSLDGEVVAGEDRRSKANPTWSELVVVVDRGERVRVIEERRSWRMLLWVERTDLADVPRYATVADVEPNEPPLDGTGVRLLPGAPVTLGAELSGFTHVTLSDWSFEMKGWLAESELDQVYTPEPVTRPDTDYVVTRSVELLDNPGGRPLGVFTVANSQPDVEVLGGRDGYREIVYYGEQFVARGFVENDAITHVGPLAYGMLGTGGRGGGFGITHRIRLTLPPDTCLYDVEGEIVGVVVEEMESYGRHDAKAGRWFAAVGSSWGIFDVRVEPPEGVDPADAAVPTDWRTCDE